MGKYIQKYLITNDNMDINYRLTPISVIMYFQDCFARYMTKLNVAAFDIIDKNLYWVIAGFNIEFSNELPFWSEEIEVINWISEISKLKITSDFELKHNDKIFAKGDACWFILNSNSKRPHPINDVVKNLETYNEFALLKHEKFTIPEIKDEVLTITHKTNLSDIDFNNHVNNKSYLNLVSMTASKDFKNSNQLKKLSVKYNKESYLGDELICSTYKTDKDDTYAHLIKKDSSIICEVVTSWESKQNERKITDCSLSVRNI